MKFSHLEQIRSLAIVGATGLVGEEFLELLAQNKIVIPKIKLLASEKSAGSMLLVNDQECAVDALGVDSFEGVDAAFFSVPEEITKKYVPLAVKAGAVVVDDSSVFRMDKEVPLVVPELNGSVLREFSGLLISTPNCSTIPLVLALKPLHEKFGVERVVVSTYQSVSGAGRKAFEELSDQSAKLLNGQTAESEVFPHRIAFNLLPQIGGIKENSYTSEEEKIIHETRKILDLPDLKITSTAVRVPTFCGHGLSVNVQLKNPFPETDVVRDLLDSAPGLKVLDNPASHIYPTNVECIGVDPVLVGRIRRDFSVPSGVNFWMMGDNLRKGAALNALQILETLYNYRRMA